MKGIVFCCTIAFVLFGCGTKSDVQYHESTGQRIKIYGSLDRRNLLIVKIDDKKILEEEMPLSTENMFAQVEGQFEGKRVSAFCTISASNTMITFCTISMDDKEIASLTFK